MVKARETSLWQWLSKARKHFKMGLHMNRVENSVMSGMADVEGCLLDAGGFWIELKTADRPKRSTTRVNIKFQPRQPEWLIRRWAVSCSAWVLVQVGSGSDARRYLIAGHYASELETGVPEDVLQKYDRIRRIVPNEKATAADVIMAACQHIRS